jgi:hypothetical protein
MIFPIGWRLDGKVLGVLVNKFQDPGSFSPIAKTLENQGWRANFRLVDRRESDRMKKIQKNRKKMLHQLEEKDNFGSHENYQNHHNPSCHRHPRFHLRSFG